MARLNGKKMTRNETQTGGPDDRERYESAVLDFLDKEMAAVQPAHKQNQTGDELDALVTDLLKQVITESDQQASGKHILIDEEDELFAGMSPTENKAPVPPEPSAMPATPEATVDHIVDASTRSAPATVAFANGVETRKRAPVMVLAFACILAAAGAGIYFLTGSSDEPAQTEAVQQAADPAPMAVIENQAAQPLPAKPLPVKPVVNERVSAKPAAAPAPQPAEAPVESKPAPRASAPVTLPLAPPPAINQAQTIQPVVSNPINNPQPAPPPPPTPVPQAAAPAVDKPAPAPAPAAEKEDSSPPVPVSKPAPQAPPQMAANVAPAPKPEPAGPRVSGKATAPVLISQTSPVFPALAVKTRTSGSVVLDLQINAEGRVVKATPVSGPVVLRDAAVNAATKWRYKPASLDGTNVPSQARITMVFNLKQ